jgi:opacity protein-like surface antigen
MRTLIVLVALAVPMVASAQEHRWELTPTVGTRWGGSVVLEEDAYKPGSYDVNFSNGGEFGLRLGYHLTPAFQLEVMVSHQTTEFRDNQGLFGEEPGGFLPQDVTGALDLEVTTWQVGLLWHLMEGSTRPYLVVAAGQSAIDSETPLPSDTALTFGLGAGVKFDLSDRLGLLLEARYNRSETDPDASATIQWEHRDCVGLCSYEYRYDDSMSQTSLVAGLVIGF